MNNLRFENMMEGASNFRSWRTRILFVQEENDIQNHVRFEITEPKGEVEKVKYRKNEGKAKRILIDYVKDHLIPHISVHETAKKMFDALIHSPSRDQDGAQFEV